MPTSEDSKKKTDSQELKTTPAPQPEVQPIAAAPVENNLKTTEAEAPLVNEPSAKLSDDSQEKLERIQVETPKYYGQTLETPNKNDELKAGFTGQDLDSVAK